MELKKRESLARLKDKLKMVFLVIVPLLAIMYGNTGKPPVLSDFTKVFSGKQMTTEVREQQFKELDKGLDIYKGLPTYNKVLFFLSLGWVFYAVVILTDFLVFLISELIIFFLLLPITTMRWRIKNKAQVAN